MIRSLSSEFSNLPSTETRHGISMPSITLRQLIYFSAVVEYEGALRAARALNVSPSAISSAIASLEQVLDKPLFVRRHKHSLVPTKAGRHLRIKARGIVSRVKQIEARRHCRLARESKRDSPAH